jgi:hypothetical protein
LTGATKRHQKTPGEARCDYLTLENEMPLNYVGFGVEMA